MIALLWRQNRTRYDGTGFWLADFVLHFIAILVASGRGFLPPFVTLILPNMLLLTGSVIMLMGLERFTGKRTRQVHNYILLVVFLFIYSWFTFGQPSVLARTICFSLSVVFILSQSAWLMLVRVGAELRRPARGVGNVLVAGCVVAIVRVIVDLLIHPGDDFYAFDIYDTLYVLLNQMIFIALTFNLFLMVNRRIFAALEGDITRARQAEEAMSISEKRYRSLFENMLDGVAYCRMLFVNGQPSDFIYLEVNPAFETLTGLRNVQGKKLSQVIPNRQAADRRFFDGYARAVRTGEAEQFETYAESLAGGSWFLVSVYGAEPEHFVVMFENITARRRMEQALKASQRISEELYELAPDALLTVNKQGEITRANAQMQVMFGYRQDELLGQQIEMLMPEGLRAHHRENRAEFLSKPHHREMGIGLELSALRKDGTQFPVEIKLSPVSVDGVSMVTAVIRDITERKQANEELRKSEEKFNTLYNRVPIAAALSRLRDGVILDVNEAFERQFGFTRQEASGKTSLELGINPDVEARAKIRAELEAQGLVRDREVRLKTKSRAERVFLLNLDVVDINNEKYILQTAHDITERKTLQDSLEKRGAELSALHQVMLDLVNRHDVNDILETMLSKVYDLLNVSHVSIDLIEDDDALVTYAVTSGQPLLSGDRMHRGEGGWLSWQAIDSGEPAVLEDYATWPRRRELYDGYPIHAIAIIPIFQRERVIGAINFSRSEANKPFSETDVYVAKQLAQMAALVLDNAQLYLQLRSEIAERLRSETALRQAQAEVIAQQRTMAMFDERQRMARDLHDSVNQSIHSLVLFSETLVSTLVKNNVSRAREISERLQESARQALKETRLLLYQSETSFQKSGTDLVQELNARLANVELRAGIQAQLILEGTLEHCPPDWQENLFWITIEALNNSLKHAQAHSVTVLIHCFPEYLELSIVDDGKGFNPSHSRVGGYGLRNMHERATILGGTLRVSSRPGNGSCILFRAKHAKRIKRRAERIEHSNVEG